MTHKARLAIICASFATLTACGQKEVPVLILPPAELSECADMPESPNIPSRDGTDETQRVRDQLTLDHILNLRTAYGSCRSKVDGLKAWRDSVK